MLYSSHEEFIKYFGKNLSTRELIDSYLKVDEEFAGETTMFLHDELVLRVATGMMNKEHYFSDSIMDLKLDVIRNNYLSEADKLIKSAYSIGAGMTVVEHLIENQHRD